MTSADSYWYYIDFVRPQNALLPAFTTRNFFAALLRASGLQLDGDLNLAYDRFLKYKVTVPVCGAIMLNPAMDKVVLVKGWKANSTWSFPRGKINRDELDRDCAVREVRPIPWLLRRSVDVECAGLGGNRLRHLPSFRPRSDKSARSHPHRAASAPPGGPP